MRTVREIKSARGNRLRMISARDKECDRQQERQQCERQRVLNGLWSCARPSLHGQDALQQPARACSESWSDQNSGRYMVCKRARRVSDVQVV